MPEGRWEEAAVGRRLRLPGHFADPVVVEDVEDWGDVVQIRIRTARGEPKDATVAAEEFREALAATDDTGTSRTVPPDDQFLLVESARIRLAYAWDPHFAVSLSGIEPLPHQLEAVYERMLPQARLRFLLADDPGSGKTIMAGLLLKELKLRGAIERTLILAPAPLAIQWQDELRSKFDEVFERVDSHLARDQLGGSPWARFPQCVASMDFAKQDHIAPDLLRERWDLVIIDEAHKVAMPDLKKPTGRFKLVRQLAERTERLLFLTATPHQGNPAQFQHLMALLDQHVFRNEEAVRRLLAEETSPWLLRRMKEDLRDFQGRKLFVERHAYSEEFSLNEHEWRLYRDVTSYINRYLPKQVGRRKASAALARMVLQRRLASSLRAIRISLENRRQRLREVVEDLDGMSEEERLQHLRKLAALPFGTDAETETDDEEDETFDLAVYNAIAVERHDQLCAEVEALDGLVDQAVATEKRGEESKLDALFACLDRAELAELRESGGKLLIFTEHRATLDYLREHLQAAGYSCCVIHGGMPAVARKQAERDFQLRKQICIGTEAAGEGINLQFCHLMINYDMPWNPNRLEQRMGRIHRFGQQREVHVFNFVAVSGPEGPGDQPVIEGRILQTLLHKLGEIRDALGDRVFDVIGLLLRTHDLNLEDVLREATYNPRLLDEYTDRIEALSPELLQRHEKATGIALARRTVDLGRIRGLDFESEERRLMPEYVEDQFVVASKRTGLRVGRRANPALLRIEHVPRKLRARNLVAIRQRGEPENAYLKASFHRSELLKPDNLDGELLSPGHPLYAVVDEVMGLGLRDAAGASAAWIDPYAREPYRLHFYEVELEGESLGDPGEPARTVPIHASLVVVQESTDGELALAQPDILHDLTEGAASPTPTDGLEQRRVEGWVRARVQHVQVMEHRRQREREVGIRRDYLVEALAASVGAEQRRQMELHARVLSGETDARLAADEAMRRVEELEAIREHRLRSLDHMGIVRSGRVAHLATAVVRPPSQSTGPAMHRDPEVEQTAVDLAIQHETERGWEVDEVWKRNDGSGFDLRSVSPPDEHGLRRVRRIEVKGRAADRGEVHLTPNEWRKAKRLGETYWLYVVWGCKRERPRLKMIRDPWTRLHGAAREVVEVKGYRIPGEALEQSEGEEWTT